MSRPAIVFIGFMGAGKSTALAAARKAGLETTEIDELMEAAFGKPIRQAFEEDGEEVFRAREAEVVGELLERADGGAVALGGGSVLSERVRKALERHIVVLLAIDAAEAWRRIEGTGRPLATSEADVEALLAERLPLYEELADAVVPMADPGVVERALPAIQALGEMPAGTRLLWASSASGDYPVFVGRDLLGTEWWPLDSRRFCVTDENADRYAERLGALAGHLVIQPGEEAKTLQQVGKVIEQLAGLKMTREDHVVALGGGVVGDMAGFCAHVYQRGVPVVQVPTTLVAQVDSAYGGKTGVDVEWLKNYAGAYHLPAGVLADTATLATLPQKELAAGFVEAIKTGLLAGGDLWERVRGLETLDPGELDDVVFACARYKCAIVAADERDAGLRHVLNLGHTVGHAIEGASGYGYLHGEAIGLGLLAALRLSGASDLRQEVEAILKRHGLPVRTDSELDLGIVLETLEADKKRTAAGVGFVLLSEPGRPRTGQIVDEAKVRAAVEEALLMTTVSNRVAVLHGVNFDVLEKRDASIYGGLSLSELERRISDWAHEQKLEPIFFQTNSEGEFCEYLHRSADLADAAIVNAGAWTHYSRAIADALQLTGLPAVEVHLSAVEERDDWRKLSVFDDLVLAKISGKGPDGYREALELLARERRRLLMRGRGDRLEARLGEHELDRMLVTDLTNVRYLTGFTGTNGACVCGPGVRLFLTDFRYGERAAAEVEGWETVTITDDWLKGIAEQLEGRTGFEDDHMSVRLLGKLKEKLAEGTEMVAAGGRVEELRRVKDEGELAKIAEASKLADEIWRWALEQGLAGRRERDVARAAEARIRELGGDPSFPAIVAAGPNGALPHAEPGEREIARGELVVFDMGAQVDGYCSDGTRTFATGEPGEEARAIYEVVRQAQRAALDTIRAGVKGEDVDSAARTPIDDAGHGEHFGHALGHGVGLEVHEGPRLSQRSEDVVAPGEVVTVEPGVYLPGKLGVRIEDLVVVTEDGLRNLSSLPKELQLVD